MWLAKRCVRSRRCSNGSNALIIAITKKTERCAKTVLKPRENTHTVGLPILNHKTTGMTNFRWFLYRWRMPGWETRQPSVLNKEDEFDWWTREICRLRRVTYVITWQRIEISVYFRESTVTSSLAAWTNISRVNRYDSPGCCTRIWLPNNRVHLMGYFIVKGKKFYCPNQQSQKKCRNSVDWIR